MDHATFPRQMQNEMAPRVQLQYSPAFGHVETSISLQWNFPACPRAGGGSWAALAVAHLGDLHGQFQTLTGLVAGLKEAAVHVTAAAAVSTRVLLVRGMVVPVGGAAQAGAHRFTGVREHQQTVPKLAEQTGEDQRGTLLCSKRETPLLHKNATPVPCLRRRNCCPPSSDPHMCTR